MKLRGLVPNSYIQVSGSDLFILTICTHCLLQQNRRSDCENISIAHRYLNLGIHQSDLLCSVKEIVDEAVQRINKE
jgi:hypothetical protein